MASQAEAMARGIEHQQTGELAQAEAMFRQVLDAQPVNKDARFRLAVVCRLQGRPAEAISLFEQLLPDDRDSAQVSDNLALAYQELGSVHKAGGALGLARQAFEQALRLQPRFPEALTNLGLVHAAEQRFEEAARCFQSSLALRPDNAVVHNNLGCALHAQGMLEPAGVCFRQALCYQPDFAEALHNLARVCWAQERWQETAELLERSAALQTPNDWTLATLARLYHFRLGKPAAALPLYRQRLEREPGNERIRMFVEALTGTSTLSQLPADYVTQTYDQDAERWDSLVRDRQYQSPHLLKTALGAAPAPHSLDTLDLGCGTGLCGLHFRNWSRSLIGIDLSPNMLAKARARGIYDRLIQGDVLTATREFVDRFDLVVASDVFLYLGELEPLLDAIYRALRPGGRLAFTIDLHGGPASFHLGPWLEFAHSRGYLRQLIARSSWLEISSNDVVFPRDHGSQAAGLVVVLGRAGSASDRST